MNSLVSLSGLEDISSRPALNLDFSLFVTLTSLSGF